MKSPLCICIFPFILLVSTLADAGEGEVIFGQSASFSGGAWEPGGRFNAGLLSAFYEVNNNTGGVNGRLLKLFSLDDQYSVDNIAPNVATLLAIPDMFVFVAFMGSPTTAAALPLVTAAEMPVVGPLTGSAVFRKTFNPWTINVRAGYDDEAFAMLRLFITEKRYRRISIIYQDDAFGSPANDAIQEAMENMNLEMTSVHKYVRADIPTYDFAEYAADLWQHRPQGIVLFCVEGFTNPFLTEMYNVMTYPVDFVTGSWIGDGNRNFLKDNAMMATNFYQTQVMPHPTLSTLNISQQYRAAMTTHADTSFDYLSMEGYVVGRMTIEALRRTPSLNRSEFIKAIYNTKLFGIEELLAGPYSDDCVHDPGTAEGRSSLCNCNQGLRVVATTSLEADTYDFVPAAEDMVYPVTECFATKDIVKRPVVFATLIPAADGIATTTATTTLLAAGAALLNLGVSINQDTEAVALTNQVVNHQDFTNETTQTLEDLGANTLLLAGIGGMDIKAQDNYLAFPAFSAFPQLAKEFISTEIHILATIPQQAAIQASFVALNATDVNAHVLISYASQQELTSQGETITSALGSSLYTEGLSLGTVATFTDGDAASFLSATAQVPLSANLWVYGVAQTDVFDVLLDTMEANTQLNVFITFNDLGLMYTHLMDRYSVNDTTSSGVLKRLRFSSNFPAWTGTGSTFAVAYQESMSLAGYASAANISNPLFFTGYALSRLLQFILIRSSGDATPSVFLEELYRTSVVSMEGVTLGPYIDQQCINDEDCLCNIGPRSVELYSVYGLLQGTESEQSLRFSKCYVEYKVDPIITESMVGIITAAVVVPVVGLASLIIGTYLFLRYKKVAHAPKDTTAPFHSMFVSLKNETVLWERRGEEMPTIMRRYHDIVDTVAGRNNCYVVKKIGGATLVVSSQADQLLKCAAETSAALEEDVRKFTASSIVLATTATMEHSVAHTNMSEGSMPSTFIDEASSAMSRRSITSASIRSGVAGPIEVTFSVGLHSARGHIKYEEDRHAYDYHGPSVDGAAVASDMAHGHQILVTNSLPRPGTEGRYDEECFIEYCTSDWGKDTVLVQFNPPGHQSRHFKHVKGANEEGVDSIAAALEQQSTGVTQKKVTVVAIHMPQLELDAVQLSRDTFAPLYAKRMGRIQKLVAKEKGHIQSIIGGRMIVTFNAVIPCPSQVFRAYATIEALRFDIDGGLTAGISSEVAIVGKFQIGTWNHQCLVSKGGEQATALQRLTAEYNSTHCLAHYGLHDELNAFAVEEFIDLFKMPGTLKPKILIAVHRMKPLSTDDEWMYEMEDQDRSNEYYNTNLIYDRILKMITGDLPKADDPLYSLWAQIPDEAKQFEGFQNVQKLMRLMEEATEAEELKQTADRESKAAEILLSPITSPVISLDESANIPFLGDSLPRKQPPPTTSLQMRPIDVVIDSYVKQQPRLL